jgi:alanine-synthesizing transaminase
VFSSRTRWSLDPNALAALLAERRLRGGEVVDLTDTNPTRLGLAPPSELLLSLADPAGVAYDPSPAGLMTAREAVASDYFRRGLSVPSDHIVLTSSSSEAYAFLFKLLCDPGDCVLVPAPSYPLFDYLAALESVELHPYPLRYDGEWHIDVGALDPLPPRARAIVVVNPNNPTGSFLKLEEAIALRRLAGQKGLALLSDEVFADYAFRDDAGRVASLAQEKECLCFSLGGLSKSCGLPQLKLGWIAVSGPEALSRGALSRLEVIADTYLSVGTPVQRALPRILSQLPELRSPIQKRVSSNLAHLEDAFARGAAASLLRPEGGWSAVLRVPATRSEEDWTLQLLSHDGVLVHPGYFFDFPEEAYLVLSLLPLPEDFQRGVGRIRSRVSRESG